VDIRGNKNLPAEKVLNVAAEAGLKMGSLRFRVDEVRVEALIREKIPEIYYVGVDIRGTRAIIEIAEKTIVQKIGQHPANIVARKAGLVKEVLVLVGNPAVKEGDTVVPGQTLISGVIPAPEAPGPDAASPGDISIQPPPLLPPTYVQARGVVRARVWYEGYGEAPVVEEVTRETGNRFSRVCMKIGGREIILKGSENVSYKEYKTERYVKKPPGWRNLSIPVEIITEEYIETEKNKVSRSRPEALEMARKKALESARAGIEGEVHFIEEQTGEVSVKKLENLVRVRAYIETLEDIGVEKPFTH
ncbi:MAG: sporulation protein YqfD, partial [Desulfocucumaceae bacterium]